MNKKAPITYNKKALLKRYEGGGGLSGILDKNKGLAAGAGIVAAGASGILNSALPPDSRGIPNDTATFGNEVLKYSSMGAALGPWGALGGAAIGATTGLLGVQKNKDMRAKLDAEEEMGRKDANTARVNSLDKTAFTGIKDYEAYSSGGTLKQNYMGKSYGGNLKKLSADSAVVEGNSHANNGVKFPKAGVELEGGETIAGDYVFSKKLGFADLHKPIAKAIGKAEKQGDSVASQNTVTLLKQKEQQLIASQEQLKKEMGLKSGEDVDKLVNGGYVTDTKMGKLYEIYKSGGQLRATPTEYGAKKFKKMWSGGAADEENFLEKKKVGPFAEPIIPGVNSDVLPYQNLAAKDYYSQSLSTTPLQSTALQPAPSIGMAGSQVAQPALTAANLTPRAIPADGGAPIQGAKGNLGDYLTTAATFIPNLAQTFRKPPMPPKPGNLAELQTPVVNMENQRDVVRNQIATADRSIDTSLSSGAARVAAKGSTLLDRIKGMNTVNEAERNANAAMKTSYDQINLGVKEKNLAINENYKTNLFDRGVVSQQSDAENLASISLKIRQATADKNLQAKDKLGMAITLMGDANNVDWRNLRPAMVKLFGGENDPDYKMWEKIALARESKGKVVN